MLPHYLTNFELQKYYQNEPKFNGVYSRNNLPEIKDGTYVIKLDEFKPIGAHWMAWYVSGNNIIYFNSFGVEHISKDIKKSIGNKNIITSIYRIHASYSIMCGYFCIGSIDFMLKAKSLRNYINLFSFNKHENNDITKIFSITKKIKMKKLYFFIFFFYYLQ